MPRLDERSHNLLRAGYYMRHPVSRVADDFTSFAHDHGLLLSDSTARRAIEGRVASEEAVTLAYRFVEHCKSNGRGIFVPPEPPITREEVVEYIKQHGTPTWFYKHVFSDLPYSTFVTFLSLYRPASEELCRKIITRLAAWRARVAEFDEGDYANEAQRREEWRAADDRWDSRRQAIFAELTHKPRYEATEDPKF